MSNLYTNSFIKRFNSLFLVSIFLLTAVFFSSNVFAAKYNVEVTGKVRGNGKKQENVQIFIYDKKGDLFKEMLAPKGKFFFKLPIDDEYIVFFVKDKFEVKVIDFNTQIEGVSLNDIWAFHNLKINLISPRDTETKKSLNAIERVDWDLTNVLFDHSFLAMPKKYDAMYKQYLQDKKYNKASRIIFKIINEYLNGTSDDVVVIQENGMTKDQLKKQAEQHKELLASLKLKRELIKLDLEATHLKLEFIDDATTRAQVAKNLADIEALLEMLDNQIETAEEDYSTDVKLLKKYENIDDQLFSIKTEMDKTSPAIDTAQMMKNYESKKKLTSVRKPVTAAPVNNKPSPSNTLQTENSTSTAQNQQSFQYNEEQSTPTSSPSSVSKPAQQSTTTLTSVKKPVSVKPAAAPVQKAPERTEPVQDANPWNQKSTPKKEVEEEQSPLNALSDQELWKRAEESRKRQQEKLAEQKRLEEEEKRKAAEAKRQRELAEQRAANPPASQAQEHYANKNDSTSTFIQDLVDNKTPIEEYNFTVGKDTVFVKRYKTVKGEFVVLMDSKNKVQLLKNNALVTESVFGEKEQAKYKTMEKLSEINVRYDRIKMIKSTSKKGLVFRVQIGALSRPNPKAFINLRDLGPMSTDLHNNMCKYMIGEFHTVNELTPIKARIKLLIPGAYNVAYYYGARIPMKQAYNLITED